MSAVSSLGANNGGSASSPTSSSSRNVPLRPVSSSIPSIGKMFRTVSQQLPSQPTNRVRADDSPIIPTLLTDKEYPPSTPMRREASTETQPNGRESTLTQPASKEASTVTQITTRANETKSDCDNRCQKARLAALILCGVAEIVVGATSVHSTAFIGGACISVGVVSVICGGEPIVKDCYESRHAAPESAPLMQ